MYLLIENFNAGMDARRMAVTSRPGTLQELINCHITRGGEIEKRKAFVPITSATLVSNSFGLHSANGQLWTFGSATSPSGGGGEAPPEDITDGSNVIVPALNYQRLLPGGSEIRFTLSATLTPCAVTSAATNILRCTLSAHGFVNLHLYSLTVGGVTANYAVTVVSENVFTIASSAITGTAVVSAGRSTSATVQEVTGRTLTITMGNVGNVGQYHVNGMPLAAGELVHLHFPEDTTQSGYYYTQAVTQGMLTSGTGIVTTAGVFTVSSSAFPLNLTSVIVNAGVEAFNYNGGNRLPYTVPWVFSSEGDIASRDATAAAVAAALNGRPNGAGTLTSSATNGVVTVLDSLGGTTAATIVTNAQTPALQPTFAVGGYTDALGNFASAGTTMTKLIHAENYAGKIYCIAEFDSNKTLHFYDGVRVLAWGAIALSGDNTSIALSLANRISKDGLYASTNSGPVISILFTENNVAHVVTASTTNGGMQTDQAITLSTTAATASTPQLTTATISGTYEPFDIFTITVDGVVYSLQAGSASIGQFVRTYNNKMYSTANSLLYFSETDTNGGAAAFSLTTTKGSGFINMANQDSGSEALTAIAVYQGKLALFSKTATQIWTMNVDPNLNAQSQILNNVGTFAPRSVVSLGNIDTYFLSSSGIRSLRARDASNVAIVSDIGTAIDDVVLEDMRALTQVQRTQAVGMVDPLEGRYWLSIGPRVYVYSYYPTPGISAWSIYEPTRSDTQAPFNIEHFATLNQRVYVRSGAVIYAYGGYSGNTYDASVASATLPYLDGGKPAHNKQMTAIDSACVGTWRVYLGMDVFVPENRTDLGTITNTTYSYGRISARGRGTHIGIKMVNNTAQYAKIGNFVAHFEINDSQ